MNKIVCALALAVLGGCASYDGRGLAPGSSEASVVAAMGAPAETVKRPNGDKVLFYSRLPLGRETFAATLAPDDTLRSIEQVLTPDNIKRIVAGSSTRTQVRELIGPPYRSARAPFKPLDVWEYPWRVGEDRRVLWIGFSDDGVAREVTDIKDPEWEPNSGASGKD